MKISICFGGMFTPQGPTWVAELTQALPQAEVGIWHPGDKPADYAVTWLPPQAFLEAQSEAKALFNAGAGVDGLLKLRLAPGVPVIRLEDVGMAEQMADYVGHALLRHFRQFDHYEAQAAAGQWRQRLAQDKVDFPVGILGLGVLGAHVAKSIAALGFTVAGWSRTPRHLDGVATFSGKQGLDDLLAATRVVVCLLPLTPDTEGILCARTIERMRAGGYIINVARGAHVVDEDLLAALSSGHLAGATLDVFREEPLPPGHPFWQDRRITITPHVSASTPRRAAIEQIAGKIRRIEAGLEVTGVVDPARGY